MIRPFSLQGTSGIIPKVKINYFEVATLAGGIATKDECRTEIEQIFINYSNQARRGIPLEASIPNVGKLQIKNNLAGIIFDRDCILEKTLTNGYESSSLVKIFFVSAFWMLLTAFFLACATAS